MTNPATTIFVFGNKDSEEDSLPIRILPKLKKEFPHLYFLHLDPSEELDIPENHLYIMDTIKGIKEATIFQDPTVIKKSAGVTVHDFDLATTLILLKKLRKLPAATIIGVPPNLKEEMAFRQVKAVIRSILGDSTS